MVTIVAENIPLSQVKSLTVKSTKFLINSLKRLLYKVEKLRIAIKMTQRKDFAQKTKKMMKLSLLCKKMRVK